MNPTTSSPRVAEAMTGRVVEVDGAVNARDAAARMAEEGVGVLAVRDGRSAPAGILTDRDLVVRLVAQGEDPGRTRISECVHGDPGTIDAEQTLAEAADAMRNLGVQRLPVVQDGSLVGVLTLADLAARDPERARSVDEATRQAGDDQRSAAWLFHRPYRQTGDRIR